MNEVDVAKRLGISLGKARTLLAMLNEELKECDRCDKPHSARERGNGMANWCEECRLLLEGLGATTLTRLNDQLDWQRHCELPADEYQAARAAILDDIQGEATFLGLLVSAGAVAPEGGNA